MRASGPPGLDTWGLPPSAASRRDTEDMLARVGRCEAESTDAWRRIEEQLRGLSAAGWTRPNAAIAKTTACCRARRQEINIAAREQAQAFDQLGLTCHGLTERLERLERDAPPGRPQGSGQGPAPGPVAAGRPDHARPPTIPPPRSSSSPATWNSWPAASARRASMPEDRRTSARRSRWTRRLVADARQALEQRRRMSAERWTSG